MGVTLSLRRGASDGQPVAVRRSWSLAASEGADQSGDLQLGPGSVARCVPRRRARGRAARSTGRRSTPRWCARRGPSTTAAPTATEDSEGHEGHLAPTTRRTSSAAPRCRSLGVPVGLIRCWCNPSRSEKQVDLTRNDVALAPRAVRSVHGEPFLLGSFLPCRPPGRGNVVLVEEGHTVWPPDDE